VTATARPRAYEYRHCVGFAETNLVGNVYFTRHLEWQGRCRELFLRDHCPEVLAALHADLALITLHCRCDYLDELSAFDDIIVRMRLGGITQNRLLLEFEYWRSRDGTETLVARGQQQLAVMRRAGERLLAAAVPDGLRAALVHYE
jgi:enediyne core biosynthesis thioesterase